MVYTPSLNYKILPLCPCTNVWSSKAIAFSPPKGEVEKKFIFHKFCIEASRPNYLNLSLTISELQLQIPLVIDSVLLYNIH